MGAKAESIGDEMKKVVARGPVAAASTDSAPASTAAPVAKPQAVPNAVTVAALVSPVTGDVVDLEQVPDEAFASKAVGDGVAVKPTDKTVVSPAAGTIVKIFNTNHAFCLPKPKGRGDRCPHGYRYRCAGMVRGFTRPWKRALKWWPGSRFWKWIWTS